MSAGGSKLAPWLDPTGAIIVGNTSSVEITRFINNVLDRLWCHSCMGSHNLQRVRTVGWKISRSRFHPAHHLQSDDIQR